MSDIPSELTIAAEHRYLNVVDAWVADFIAGGPGIDVAEQYSQDMVLATHEAVANLVDHAYSGQGGAVRLSIVYDRLTSAVVIQIFDNGRMLNVADLLHTTWADCPDGQALLAVEEPTWDQIRGRGLFLIHSLTDVVRYQKCNGTNCWTLIKQIKN